MKAFLNPNLFQLNKVDGFERVGASYYWSKEQQALIRVNSMAAEIVYQEENENGELVYALYMPKTQTFMEIDVALFMESMELV